MKRTFLLNLLKILVSLSLLIFIFSSLDRQAFFGIVGQAHPVWLIAALATTLGGVLIRAFRWQILLKAIQVEVPLGELTAIYFIGFLFNNLLPSGLGGDAIRMLELSKHTERGSDAVTSVVVDRFLGLSSLQAIALAALLFDWRAIPAAVAYFTVVILAVSLTFGYLLINRRLYLLLRRRVGLFRRLTGVKKISNLFESFQRYPLPALGKAYLVALLFNLSLIAMNIFLGLAVGAKASLAQYAVFVPVTSLVLLIPISFAGLGVREETYRQLFGQIGVPNEIAVAMSLLVYVFGNIFTGLIGGVVYLWRSARSAAGVEVGIERKT
jgi:uncharacterized protein (TIRG00374 family)